MARPLEFYLALTSPWTYLATPRIREIVEKHGLDLRLRPFDIFSVFKRNGTKPVGERPKPVQENRLNELRRWSQYLDMPLNLHPKHFPVDPTLSGKMLIAAGKDAGKPFDFAFGVMRACWAEERDISDGATLEAIAGACGLDGAALRKEADGDEVGARFQKNTDDAIANDVFGAPTFVFEGERYWGQDRIDFIRRAAEAGG